MSQLPQLMSQVRRHVRRAVLVRGAGWSVATIAAGVAIAAGTDALLHVESDRARLAMLLIALACGAGVAAWLMRPLRHKWDDVTVALLLERLDPRLHDRVASGVFLTPEEHDAGDAAAHLRNRARERAEAAVHPEWTARIVDVRRILAGWGALAAVLVLVAVWIAASPVPGVLALERSVAPLGAPDWPRSTVLALLDEHLDPLGQLQRPYVADEPLSLYVENLRGALPPDVALERDAGDSTEKLDLTLTTLRDARGRERRVAVATLTPEAGTLRLRARGGDDREMPWLTLSVAPAPRLERFRLHVEPPEYSGLPAVDEERASGHVEGLIGSRVFVEALSNVPLESVQLHRDGRPPRPLPLVGDRTRLTADFEIDVEGRSSYWFELTDPNGLSSSRPVKYEVRGRRDRPPELSPRLPTGALTATPRALLPVEVDSRDDLGLGPVTLNWSIPGGGSGQVLLRGEADPESAGRPVLAARLTASWDLQPLALAPGQAIEYQFAAEDLQAPEPQRTLTPPQSVQIVSADEKRQEISGYQAGMARLLAAAVERQQSSRQNLRDLTTQWTVAGALRPQSREKVGELQRLARQLAGELTDGRAGLTAQIRTVRQQLEWNRLSDAATSARMVRLETHLSMLVEQLLPAFREAMAGLDSLLPVDGDEASPGSDDAPPAGDLLAQAGDMQAAIGSTLDAMLAELDEWRQQRELSTDLDDFLASQQAIRDDTARVGETTLALSEQNLSAQQRADLATLADRQRQLAARVEQLRARHEPRSEPLAGDDSTRSVLDKKLAARMQQSAAYVASNRIGQALSEQQEIIAALAAAAEQATTEHAANGARELAAAREAVETLRKQQAELQQEFAGLRPMSAEAAESEELEVLRKGQGDLTEQLESLASDLRQGLHHAPANTAARAAARSRDAFDALRSPHGERVDAAQQATLDDLQQLDDELAAALSLAEQERLTAFVMELAAVLGPLGERQQNLAEETQAMHARRRTDGRFGRSELRRIGELADSQSEVQAAVQALLPRATGAPLLESVLDGVAANLGAAEQRLTQRQIDEATAQLQQEAADRMFLLRDSLAEARARPESPAVTSSEGAPENPAAAAANWLELKLLRSLQADLMARTQSLRQLDPTVPGDDNRWKQLAQEQIELATRAEEILKRAGARPPAAQTGLPDKTRE